MKANFGTLFASAAASLFFLCSGAPVTAQDVQPRPPRYSLKDLGTFGGPNSFVTFTTRPLNDAGTVVGIADTPAPDPFDPDCFLDCVVAHTFQWRNGNLWDLGSLVSGASSGPNGINSRGVVAGISQNGALDPQSPAPPEFRAVVWNHGRISDLGTLGGTFSYASAINDRNQVVGFALNATPEPYFLSECGSDPVGPTQMRAFVWNESDGLRELGTLGGPDSCAMFINNRGNIAGNSFTSNTPNPATGVPTQDPFIWKGGVMTDLGGLGGTLGHVSAMNDRGQICGDSNLGGDQIQHGFFWQRGKMTDLTPDAAFGVAEAMNDRGDVVGGALNADETAIEGYLWRRGSRIRLLGLETDGCSGANAINASGLAVGDSFPCTGEETSRAVLWEHAGPAIDLNTVVPSGSGLTLTNATAINDAGEITGRALLADGTEHAYLLIPRAHHTIGDSPSSVGSATGPAAGVGGGTAVRSPRLARTPEEKAALRRRLTNRSRASGYGHSKGSRS